MQAWHQVGQAGVGEGTEEWAGAQVGTETGGTQAQAHLCSIPQRNEWWKEAIVDYHFYYSLPGMTFVSTPPSYLLLCWRHTILAIGTTG